MERGRLFLCAKLELGPKSPSLLICQGCCKLGASQNNRPSNGYWMLLGPGVKLRVGSKCHDWKRVRFAYDKFYPGADRSNAQGWQKDLIADGNVHPHPGPSLGIISTNCGGFADLGLPVGVLGFLACCS